MTLDEFIKKIEEKSEEDTLAAYFEIIKNNGSLTGKRFTKIIVSASLTSITGFIFCLGFLFLFIDNGPIQVINNVFGGGWFFLYVNCS